MPGEQQPQQYTQGQLDAMARERGFSDYATYAAWYKNYRAPLARQGGQTDGQPTNWLQNLINQIPIHPSYLMNYASDRINEALDKIR